MGCGFTVEDEHELLAKRWSPYAFSDRPVSKDDLLSLFEARPGDLAALSGRRRFRNRS
jgi:hypothetical protein